MVVALAVVSMFAWFTPGVSDNDAWWQLKTGQYIVQQHRLPMPDPFAYTTYMGHATYAGEERVRDLFLTHEWLSQVIFYGVYAIAGFAGLVLLRAAMLAGMSAIIGWLVMRRTGELYRGLFASLMTASVALSYRADRPFLMSFFLLAATLLVLDGRKRLWLLPLIFVLWSNCHGDFVLGWAAMGAYCAESLYQWRNGQAPADWHRLWIWCGAAVLASGLNPNGFSALILARTMSQSAVQQRVWEWRSPTFWPPQPFNVVMIAALVVLVWQRKRVRVSDWLLFAGYAIGTVMAARNLMLTGFAASMVVATYLPWRAWSVRLTGFAAAAGLLILAAVPVARGHAFQLNAVEWNRPSGAVNFLLNHGITGRIFNSYNEGGYLIWRLGPERKVFVDGRALNEFVMIDFRHIANNHAVARDGKSAADLLNDYGVEAIVMEGFEAVTGIVWPLPLALATSVNGDWKLVYADANSFVFLRHPPAGMPALSTAEFLASLEKQCHLRLDHDPAAGGCSAELVRLFQRVGDAARAQKWMAIAIASQAKQ